MPILTTAGVLQGGIITDVARRKFVDDVATILRIGNAAALFKCLPDALIFVGSPFLGDSFTMAYEEHVERFSVWHKVFIDVMFQSTANALDIDGSTPLAPIVDYSMIFADLGFPRKELSLNDFAAGMSLIDPTFQSQLQFFFEVDINDITPELLAEIALAVPVPGAPSLPIPVVGLSPMDLMFDVPSQLPTPELPGFIIQQPPPLQFPDPLPLPVIGFTLCAVVEAIPKIFGILLARALAGELITALSDGPVGLITFVSAVVIDAIASCLGIELRNVITFLASFTIYIERLIAMLIVVLLGTVFGEGQLIVTAANAFGLT